MSNSLRWFFFVTIASMSVVLISCGKSNDENAMEPYEGQIVIQESDLPKPGEIAAQDIPENYSSNEEYDQIQEELMEQEQFESEEY